MAQQGKNETREEYLERRREEGRRRYAKHKEKLKEKEKLRRIQDGETIREKQRARYHLKKEGIRYLDRIRYAIDSDRRKKNLERVVEWQKENKEHVAEYQRKHKAKYREENPEKVKARNKVAVAVRNGTLKKPNACQVCRKEVKRLEGHHKDYSLPLEVIWVCRGCHKIIHEM